MKPLYVLNDTHLGAIRSGGTTPRSAWALRQYLLQRFDDLLQQCDGPLLLNGDVLDTFNIPYLDLLKTYLLLRGWLSKGHRLHLSWGNHDVSKVSANVSSFGFLCSLLSEHPNVTVFDQPGPIKVAGADGWVIPHMANQDLFNLKLQEVPQVKYLFLHCNYDNKFAQEADHSLNLSPDQARALPVERIIIAHEHQRSEHLQGKVLLPGNQIPSSVADCLGNDAKHMLQITDQTVKLVPVWQREGSFVRVDWRELSTAPADAQFIRVEGDASTAEAAGVATAISKLRGKHEAFVITNAVKIEGRSLDTERISLEQIQSYNVLDALMKRLKPAQQAVVKKLMEDNNV
jgi:hypothetical protein